MNDVSYEVEVKGLKPEHRITEDYVRMVVEGARLEVDLPAADIERAIFVVDRLVNFVLKKD